MNSALTVHLANQALKEELETTPKPGLVDLHDNGSHTDMDFDVMSRGIDAVSPFFGLMFDTAAQMSGRCVSAEIMSALRKTGRDAEDAMLAATGGVNTHKGAIFSFGLVSGALGVLESKGAEFEPTAVRDVVKQLADGIEDELNLSKRKKEWGKLTAGEKFFARCGQCGARGQAADGYAFVVEKCLPLLRRLRQAADACAGLKTLSYIMSLLDDSNVYKRGGSDGVEFVKASGKDLFENFSQKKAEELNDLFVKRNLSPGGAADLLALTFFLDKTTEKFK